MTINLLKKGTNINLSKEAPNLKKVRIGLGWNANSFDSGFEYDLDVSAFVCLHDAAGNPKLINEKFMVFYNELKSPDGAVVHSGDSREGKAEGDDEVLYVDLSKLDPRAVEISLIVTIHEAVARRQNFGQVTKSYIKLYNDETDTLITQYNLEEDFSAETAVQFGSLYKVNGDWKFKAIGQGYNKGLADFVNKYVQS